MFDSRYRKARAAEGAGDYRRAAALYAEAEMVEEAANALLFAAGRATTLEDRLAAYHDALRWLPEGHPRRDDVQAQIGLAVLDDARRAGARTAEERRRLTDAAERLEGAGRPGDAATAWELLERWDDVGRCLEAAGDIERLERFLERTSAEDDRRRKLATLVKDYEMAMTVGARLDAHAALREAVRVDPTDASVADLLRRFEKRVPQPNRIELVVNGSRVIVVGRLPATLGRAGADVPLRGASVSRRHAELDVRDGSVVVRDLDSRNGTLVRGLAIAGEVLLAGETTVGLGDDVTLKVSALGPRALSLEVEKGLDRGVVALLGEGALPLPDAPASVSFPEGRATIAANGGASLVLGPQPCALPVVVLDGDTLSIGAYSVEVRA
jgi:tetratricopeptide (TPR) repeat protein